MASIVVYCFCKRVCQNLGNYGTGKDNHDIHHEKVAQTGTPAPSQTH